MAVFWDVGKHPLWIETLHNLVKEGSMTSRHSLIKKVGTGSRSQLFEGEALMILEMSSERQMSNEFRSQSAGVKTGGGEPEVAERIASTLELRNERNSDGVKGGEEDVLEGLPRTVDTVRQSFFESDFCSVIVRSQYWFSFVLKK